MKAEVDGINLKIQVRCTYCDEVLYIEDKYEDDNGTLVITVDTKHECFE